jgi:UDP-N-acetylglucosamine acyltransferase
MQYIHPTAQIGKHVTIEDDVYIGPFCIIGFPAEWKGMEGIDKGVLIKSGSRLTGHVTVDSGAVRKTEIGKNCYLMKHSHVGHDCVIQDDVTISCGAKIGGHAIIGNGTNIGLNAVIHQRQQIAQGCMIGMGAVVTKGLETKENSKYVGNPARYLSKNK